jgi:L-ascorbate metabolism protein UlaG (beta-lactamase superfamily)
VEFAVQIGCKVVIPHHHDFTKVDDPAIVEEFKQAFLARVPDGTFVTPKHGEWVHL